MGGLVEAILLLQILDELRIKPLRTAVAAGGAPAKGGLTGLGTGRHVTRRRAADARRGLDVGAGDLGDKLFHRTARGGLDDGEIDHHDAEQGRYDEQQPADDISDHLAFPSAAAWPRLRSLRFPALTAAAFLASNHQVSISTPRRGILPGRPNLSQ